MKRICRFIVSLWLLSFLVFFMSRLAPGDPLTAYYGDRVEKMSVEEFKSRLERAVLCGAKTAERVPMTTRAFPARTRFHSS